MSTALWAGDQLLSPLSREGVGGVGSGPADPPCIPSMAHPELGGCPRAPLSLEEVGAEVRAEGPLGE